MGKSLMTLKFDEFWRWLHEHANCILRVGTEDFALFDQDDLHWHLEGDARQPVIQLIQGKRLMAELIMDTREVAFVQASPEASEPGDQTTLFELVVTGEGERFSSYHFLMAHPQEQSTAAHPPGLRH
ncbi:MAG: hypothetical protein ACKVPX_04830 [Myxococcaceae bacterium]